MNFIIIIPARFFSSRFPGKLLADIHGKPMIIRVIEKALTTMADKIIVATDNIMVTQAIKSEYSYSTDLVEVCVTRSSHQSGTERLVEVVKHYQFLDNQIIVQLQGDEPLISSHMIHQVVQSLLHKTTNTTISVTTLATPIRSLQEARDDNIVKVVVNINNDALYFSRSMIPWNKIRDNSADQTINLLLRHIGIYSYRVDFLYHYAEWAKSPLEQFEMLEQLRVLWHGKRIRVSIIDDAPNISVDTPESLKRVNDLFLIK